MENLMKLKKLGMLLLVCTLSAGLTACGGKTDDDGEGSKKSAKERLVGKWEATLKLDEERMKKMLSEQGVPAAMLDAALEEAKKQSGGDAGKISLTVNADGTSEAVMYEPGNPEPDKNPGKWEVVSEDGDNVTLKITDDADGESQEVKIKFDGNDSFTFSMKELEQAPISTPVFKRQ